MAIARQVPARFAVRGFVGDGACGGCGELGMLGFVPQPNLLGFPGAFGVWEVPARFAV